MEARAQGYDLKNQGFPSKFLCHSSKSKNILDFLASLWVIMFTQILNAESFNYVQRFFLFVDLDRDKTKKV